MLSFLPQLAGWLVMLTEVQTSVPIMWQIRPQPDFILVAFPSYPLYLALFLHVMGKIPPLLSLFPSLFFILSLCKKKKKKKKKTPSLLQQQP